MLCPAAATSRKQVLSSGYHIRLIVVKSIFAVPSPPLPSSPRSPLPPTIPIKHRNVHQQHRLVLSLPNSPRRKLGQFRDATPAAGRREATNGLQSLAVRLFHAMLIRPSRSSDSLHAQTKPNWPGNSSKRAKVSTSCSLSELASPSPALCRFWEGQRHRDMAQQNTLKIGPNCAEDMSEGAWKGGAWLSAAAGRSAPGPGERPECRRRRWPPGDEQRAAQSQREALPPPLTPNFGPLSPRCNTSIPTSHSFPPPTSMAASSSHLHAQQHAYNELEDFDDDFVPRSSTAVRQSRQNSMDTSSERIQIRRMSLKEFSGLDLLEEQSQQKAAVHLNAGGIASPLLHPWKGGQLPALGSLIDKFSTRRRSSSSGGMKLSATENAGAQSAEECPFTPFDRAIDGISQAIQETTRRGENGQKQEEEQRKERQRRGSLQKEQHGGGTGRGSFGQTLQRLTNIRNHLNSTLQSVPNVSPHKAQVVDKEKLLLLNECRVLVAACKDMVRTANPSPLGQQAAPECSGAIYSPAADCLPLVQAAVDSAELVAGSVEQLIRKSNSIFQAQQLTTNADQLLKALADTVREVEKCQKEQTPSKQQSKSFDQTRQLIRCSTTLAANLISFTEMIRGMG